MPHAASWLMLSYIISPKPANLAPLLKHPSLSAFSAKILRTHKIAPNRESGFSRMAFPEFSAMRKQRRFNVRASVSNEPAPLPYKSFSDSKVYLSGTNSMYRREKSALLPCAALLSRMKSAAARSESAYVFCFGAKYASMP